MKVLIIKEIPKLLGGEDTIEIYQAELPDNAIRVGTMRVDPNTAGLLRTYTALANGQEPSVDPLHGRRPMGGVPVARGSIFSQGGPTFNQPGPTGPQGTPGPAGASS